ncbi:shikimate kinase [Brevibacillus sp. SYP-B805]|uniref:shikimate kinase n=1 Tax=Brevibacillus sp. SYP-B805 TaxID=1578199 RepID=UPI0013EAABEF|nr:shikimate kinase [Brevibacillus sp. SYP-B805]NGQ94752.1 shikimate kinase [Brevibacillus sp. SYP-B805]
MENIVLVGFMGTGKSTVGRALAAKLNWTYVDLDRRIAEREGRSIPELFRTKGEAYFRDVESALLAELLGQQRQVIATGGGAVLRPANVTAMLQGGLVVALFADEAEIVRRVSSDAGRPLLAGDPAARVKALLQERAGAYDFAPLKIDTTAKQVETIVAEIAAKMVEHVPFRTD